MFDIRQRTILYHLSKPATIKHDELATQMKQSRKDLHGIPSPVKVLGYYIEPVKVFSITTMSNFCIYQ